MTFPFTTFCADWVKEIDFGSIYVGLEYARRSKMTLDEEELLYI